MAVPLGYVCTCHAVTTYSGRSTCLFNAACLQAAGPGCDCHSYSQSALELQITSKTSRLGCGQNRQDSGLPSPLLLQATKKGAFLGRKNELQTGNRLGTANAGGKPNWLRCVTRPVQPCVTHNTLQMTRRQSTSRGRQQMSVGAPLGRLCLGSVTASSCTR